MALAFDNAAGTATTAAANVRTFALTATTGAVLLVWTVTGSGAGTVSSVAANGVALTELGAIRFRTAAPRYSQLWGLTAPGSGVLSISAVIAAAETTNFAVGGATYTGHKTDGTPFGGVVTGSASATTQASLIISATTDNLAVFGFIGDGGIITVGATLTKRFQGVGGGYPFVTIADKAGALAVTGTASSGSAYWGNLGINLIASTGAATITGSMSATDAPDTFSAPAYVLVSGRVSATDALDTFAATGKVIVSGRVSATDAGSDTLSAPGYVLVSGRLSATDAQDTFVASGYTLIQGRLSATDATDTFAASGYSVVSGRLSATDAVDTFAATGQIIVSGRLSATDAPDTFLAVSGLPNRVGSMSATDAQDTFAATAQVIVSGVVAATDSPDSFSASGTVLNFFRTGSMSAVDSPDTFAATGYVVVQGSVAATDNPDTFAAVGTVSSAAVVVTSTTDPGAGHGKRKNNKLGTKPPYIPASRDFWDARERYLESLQPEITAEPSPEFSSETPAIAESELPQYDPAQLVTYSVKRTELIAALPTATTMRQLRSYGDELRKINRLILRQKLMGQLIEQAARDARAAERQRRIARKRRILATLKQAHDLLSLLRSR